MERVKFETDHPNGAESDAGTDDLNTMMNIDDSFGVIPGGSDFGDVADDATDKISEKESRLVSRSKIVVLIVLVASAGLCGWAAYFTTVNGETKEFESAFRERAQQLVDSSQAVANGIFNTVESMATSVTSYAKSTNATWPYLTIPDYARRGEQLLRLSSARFVYLLPLVETQIRDDWEQWANQNLRSWVLDEEVASQVKPYIHRRDWRYPNSNWTSFRDEEFPEYGYFMPVWQIEPVLPPAVLWNGFDLKAMPEAYLSVKKVRAPIFTRITNMVPTTPGDWPRARLVNPVFESFDDDSNLVALYSALIGWHKLLEGILPEGAEDVVLVLENSCDQVVSYLVQGPTVTYLGIGDKHDPQFDGHAVYSRLDKFDAKDSSTCSYSVRVYPTENFRQAFRSTAPIIYTAVVVLIFVVTSFVFFLYDCLVQKRQTRVASSAQRSNAIVSSLFPEQVRERLLQNNKGGKINTQSKVSFEVRSLIPIAPIGSAGPNGLEKEKEALLNSRPIADLFPSTTVLFADIVNFTAWSSVREPSQVFMLLEQIYGSYDAIARRRGIFKVETIGDCYVAVAGLPKPRKDHAECMAKFAHECRAKMQEVVRHLEVVLGPDTADLTMRFGLHSGPVTAGVLRGEKSRFQLFGDTVNTASRIESTGEANQIHMSHDTASALIARGYGRWVEEREGSIDVKGKGLLKTYWMVAQRIRGAGVKNKRAFETRAPSVTSDIQSILSESLETPPKDQEADNDIIRLGNKIERLVEWNVDILHRQLKKIAAMRGSSNNQTKTKSYHNLGMKDPEMNVLDEVREIIALPSTTSEYKQDPTNVELGDTVKEQLRNYVSMIASMYHHNPFHSFEHASHVTQSVSKLLARVVTPDKIDYTDMCYKRSQGEEQMHQYTYGITSDPLTHFACIFSALIHDVDHSGLPNATLVKEESGLAKLYRNKSVAEQNSVDLAWNLLMEPMYQDLRACIYSTQDELERFRQLVVNSVMATDIVDKELGALRKKRWAKAFTSSNGVDSNNKMSCSPTEQAPESPQDDVNRKATIVIEHIIQASDVSHTMQHWHVYIKWNEKLFDEMYKAFLSGRADKDPSQGWYEGELGFFDFYLIPLGNKLKECGVFGVASDEYLNYAIANRREWEQKGREIVKSYMTKYAGK